MNISLPFASLMSLSIDREFDCSRCLFWRHGIIILFIKMEPLLKHPVLKIQLQTEDQKLIGFYLKMNPCYISKLAQ